MEHLYPTPGLLPGLGAFSVLVAWLSPAPWRPADGLTPYHLPTNPGGAACIGRVVLSTARQPLPTRCYRAFTWLQAPAHGVSPAWDKEIVGSRPSSTLCPLHVLLLLLRVSHGMAFELPSCPTAMSCSHLLTVQTHCKLPGQWDWPQGDPAALGASPLPGHCVSRGDRAGGEGSHPDPALY